MSSPTQPTTTRRNTSKRHRWTDRPALARITIGKRFLVHGLAVVTAVAAAATFEAADAGQALAIGPIHQGIGLSLSNSTSVAGQWVATGSAYTPGLKDVQIWIMNVTGGGWSTLEYQSGLKTSGLTFPEPGLFSAAGKTKMVLIDPDVGYRKEAVHPLKCGHQYQAVTYDPSDGYVYSNVLHEAACQ